MKRNLRAGSYRREGSSRLGGVQFSAPAVPKDPAQRIKAEIIKDLDFIRRYGEGYPTDCRERSRRIRHRVAELVKLCHERLEQNSPRTSL